MKTFDEVLSGVNGKRKYKGYESYANVNSDMSFDEILSNRAKSKIQELVTSYSSGVDLLYRDYQSRYMDSEGNYTTNKYRTDSTEWKDSTASRVTPLKTQADEIKSLLGKYKDSIDTETYSKLSDYLEKSYTDLDNIANQAVEEHNVFSRCENEYDYNAYIMNNTDGQDAESRSARNSAYEENAARIAELDKLIENYKPDNERKIKFVMNDTGILVPQWDVQDKNQSQLDSLKKERDKLIAENNKYKHGNGANDSYFIEHAQKDDYVEDSGKRDFSNPTKEQTWEKAVALDNSTWEFRDGKMYDVYGNEIGVVGNQYVHPLENSRLVVDPLGLFLNSSEDEKMEGIGRYTNVGGGENDEWAETMYKGDANSWEELTEEEIGMYYYLLNNDGTEKAVKYLDELTTELNRRTLNERTKMINEADGLEKIALNIASVPANILGGVSAFAEDAIRTASGKDINPYSQAHSAINFAQAVRTSTANDINAATGASSSDFITWGDAYQGIMSGIDSAVGSLTIGKGYTVLMGMGAASTEARELYEKGASRSQIAAGGFLAGAAEALFEYASVEVFFKNFLESPIKSKVKMVLKGLTQAGVEASEEFATTISNYLTDALVMGSQSDWQKAIDEYKKIGYSDGGATWQAIKKVGGEALHDAAVGAISGGLMGGVGNVAAYSQYNAAMDEKGKSIIDNKGVDTVKDVALKLASEMGKRGTGLTRAANAINGDSKARNIGKLADKANDARSKLNKADIKSALIERGVSKSKAENYANILAAMNEEYFNSSSEDSSFTLGTNEQWERMTGDKNAYSILSEIVTNSESAVNMRNLRQSSAMYGIRVDENGKLNKDDLNAYQEREIEKVVSKVTGGGLASKVENSQELSDDGKTYADIDGESVEVTKKLFVNGEGGKLNISVNDGKVVGVDKVSYGDLGEAYVVSSIVDLGVGAEDANFLYSMFNGKGEKAGKAFANGISLAFKYGRYLQSTAKLADIAGVTKAQAEAAYKIGKESRSTEAKAAKAKLNEVAEANEKEGKKAQTKGSVVFEGDIADENGNLAAGEDSLTDIQKASVNGVKLLAELTPLNFHFFQSTKDGNTYSYVKQNGQKTHANGWYRVGTNDIYIDLNAGQDGQGTIMYTAAHEISHFIKQFSPEKWNDIAEYIMNEYTKHYGGDVETLLLRQITKVKNRPDSKNKTQREIEDEAFEELVCDSLSKMLVDGTVVEAMANIKQKNKGVWNTIKNAVLKLLEKWSEVIKQYTGRNPDAEEAGYFKETTKAFKNLQKMLTEAFVDAGDTYSKVGNIEKAQQETLSARDTAEESKALKKFGKDLGDVERNSNGDMLVATNEDNSTVMYSERTWNEGGKEKFISLMETLGHGEQAQEYAKYLDDALDYLHELAVGYEILGQHLDATITTDIKNGKQVLSAIVNNGEYPVNIDLALICKKRVAYMRLMAKMIEDGVFGDVKYDGDAIAEVNGILRKNGFETACLGCFVESRRLQFQTWAETIVQEWNEAVEARNKNAKYFRFADGKADLTDAEIEALEKELESGGEKNAKGNLNLGQGSVADKMGKLLDKAPTLVRKLTVDDLLTPQGLTALRATDDDLFSLVKQRYGAASPKIVQDYNPYASEIADLTFNFVKNVTGNTVKGAQDYIKEAKKEFINEQPPKSAPKQRKKESDEDFKARKAEYDAKKNAYNAKVEALAMRKYLYSIGGARIQSFSDFMIENVFDYLQIFADLSAKELPMHGYTKEISALRLFGMTGAKWNGSLIAHVEKSMGKEYAGLLPASEAKNGNGILVKVDGKDYCIAFDDYSRNKATNGKSFIQSIGMKDIVALMYDPRYSPYVGNITIGVSDKQITAMLDSPLFRMVIPYHASGMLPQFAQLVGVDMYNDYTNYQNTTVKEVRLLDGVDYRVEIGDTGKPVVKNADREKISIDTHYAFNENLQKYGDARKTCQDYLAWCRNDHAIYDKGKLIGYATFNPKFSDSPTGVDFTKHRNYYKLIEDFNTYDNITEKAAQQGAVTMTFPSAENRLTAEQKKAYEKALRDTGIFTDEDIKKYLEKADMTFEDIVRAEVGNRKAYNDAQEPKFQSTVKEVEDFLLNAKDEKGNYKFRRDSYADTASDYLEGKKQGVSLKPAKGSYLDEVLLSDRDGIRKFNSSEERLTENVKTLAGMNSVYDVPAVALEDSGKEIQEIYKDFFDEWGGELFSNELGTIDVKPSSIRSERRHGNTAKKIASIEAIPTVVKNGKIIFANYKDGTDVLRIIVAAPIKIDGKPHYMGVMVQRDSMYQRLYLHDVVIEEETPDFSQVDLLTTGTDEKNERLFVTNILQQALNVKYNTKNEKLSDRTTAQIDADYMKAIENGNMETAQKLVDEVAKKAGYSVKAYHGTGADFNIFSEDKIGGRNVWGKGFYFGTSKGIADDYATMRESKGGKYRVVSAYLKMDNPFIPYKSDLGNAEQILDKWFPDMWKTSRELGIGYIQGKLENSPHDLVEFMAEHNGIEIKDVLATYGFDSINDGGELVVFNAEQIKSADPVTYDDNGDVIPLSKRFDSSEKDIRYSERVTDKETLDFLNEQIERGEYITVYRSFQVIDGGLYAPMNAVDRDDDGKNKRLGYRSEIGKWEKATESRNIAQRYMDAHPDAPYAKFDLDGGDNKTGGVAYNPYLHASNLVLNDQFSAAYRRNLVTVECRVPLSEAEGAYKADYAKDGTGWANWKAGGVANRLNKIKPEYERRLFLSRYMLPVKILSDAEVASMYKEYLDGTDISVPWNVVTPSLRNELEKAGVSISYEDVKRSNGLIKFEDQFPEEASKIRYSDRTATTSTRELLANALESTIDTSTQEGQYELKKLNEYKEMVGTLDELNAKLNELRSSLFKKGVTGEERRRIQDEATKTANRISVYDKKLLTLEASKPLKKVLDREKAQAAKRQKAKDAKDFKAYKDEMKKKQKERETQLRDSRTAAIEKVRETRDKNEAKAKLQKLVLETAKWISYPKKGEVKCPDFLRLPYATFIGSIDFSSKTLLETGEKTKNDEKMALAMHNLAEAINKVRDAQNPATDANEVLDSGYLDLPAKFVDDLRELAAKVESLIVDGDFVINRMSSTDIKSLAQLVRTLNHSIREMSTLYANARFAKVEQLGDNSISFMEEIGEIDGTSTVVDFATWENALPYYAFKRFGKGGESVFEELMDAQDKMAFLADEIIKFREKVWNDKESKAWSKDTHTIELPSGKTLTLTTADAMSIYCLARRDNNQGMNHLVGGGVRVLGQKTGAKEAKDSRANLDLNDVVAICESLDSRQIEVAEAIQEFMSTVCSEWGNEISMKRFLTKDFTEKRYFPIQSNDEVLAVKDPQAQQSDLFRLLNISATKPLTPNANNSVVIRNIFDVFTEHTSDMARLNAYGMALLDYMKWINYNEKTKNDDGQITVRGVRPAMNNAYGKKALSYAINLVKDINGRFNDGGDHPWLMKMTRNAKTAAVGSSLRVAALQLTAYPRAAMVLSTGNLAKGLFKKPQISKAKKYCGIALWKSFGFYDTNISRSIEDQIKGTTNWKQKLVELSLKGAEWGDAVTWGYLWNACEYDVAASNKQLKVGTEEFNQTVGKRLREVVYTTQVVDSVLTRTQLMRNKSGLTQTATAFMSEPAVTYNIIMDAGFQFNLEKRRTGSAKIAWQKTGGKIVKAATVYGAVAVITSLLESLIDAYRDDEDDEFLEKYGRALLENSVSNFIPFNKLPFAADAVEMILSWFNMGYFSTDRLDTTWLTDIEKAGASWIKVFGESFGVKDTSVTVYKALYDTVKAFSSTTGVAYSGILRELVTFWNNTAGAANPELKIKKYDK